MRILDELSNMIMIGLVIFSILAVIIMAVLIIMKMNNKAGGIYEEGNDYSLLKRMDSEDYLKFDDIAHHYKLHKLYLFSNIHL